MFLLLVVEMVSGGSECPEHGLVVCPICGCVLVWIKYFGDKPDILALMERDDFRGFLGCVRVDLHDKVVDGVDYRGKVFVRPIFKT